MARVIHAREASRFYRRDGVVVFEVPKTSGEGTRDPNITDARKNGWLPSVSEILTAMSQKALMAWKLEHMLDCAVDNPINEGEEPDNWKKRVSEISKEYAALAAARGTEIHKAVEQAILTGVMPIDPACERAVKAILQRYEGYKLVVEESFTSEFGFAGTIDIQGYPADPEKPIIIGDIKTKDIKKFRKPHFENGLQMGGYRIGKECDVLETIIIDRETGETLFFRWGDMWKKTQSLTPEVLSGAFLSLFDVWKKQNNYDPEVR